MIGPGSGLPTIPDKELAGKDPTIISITGVSAQGYRGETIHVLGALTSGGEGLGGQAVNIFLMKAVSGNEESTRVGYATTRADGSFTAEVAIPPSFELASYDVYAATPGDDAYAPSVSE